MCFRDTIEFAHVALGLIPEVLDAIDVIMTVCKELRMINAKVAEIGYIQHVVAAPTVRIDYAVMLSNFQ